jgi:hypothetical protein
MKLNILAGSSKNIKRKWKLKLGRAHCKYAGKVVTRLSLTFLQKDNKNAIKLLLHVFNHSQ